MRINPINPADSRFFYSSSKTENSVSNTFSNKIYNPAFYGIMPAVSHFEKEISEQPEVLNRLAGIFFQKPGAVNIDLNITPEEMKKIKRISITASGSSKNAGEAARNFIEKAALIPVNIESAGEYMLNQHPADSTEDLALFISQSGKTADTLQALKNLSDKGIKSIAVTNEPLSEIAEAADFHQYIYAGPEYAAAASKTVTGSIFTLIAIGMRLGLIKGSLNEDDINYYASKLKLLPNQLKEILKDTENVKKAAEIISKAGNIYCYAKGANIGAMKEGALKLTETSGLHASAESSSEALHGMFSSIEPKNAVLQTVLGNPESGVYKTAAENIKEIIKKRGIEAPIIIRTQGDYGIERFLNHPNAVYIDIPETDEMAAPILTAARMQQITNETAKILNISPDTCRNAITKYRQNLSM